MLSRIRPEGRNRNPATGGPGYMSEDSTEFDELKARKELDELEARRDELFIELERVKNRTSYLLALLSAHEPDDLGDGGAR
jgi:hypothetical protein